jgi:CheY-like chemotaxis protein
MTNKSRSVAAEKSEEGKLRILVVDDDDDIRFMLAKILNKEGYCVTEAANAAAAEIAALGEIPDLVLMDIGMPEVDGLTAVWRMRERPELAEVPVVILSAYDSFDLRAEATAEGCKAYLTKPLDPDMLISKLREILR